jgi:excisionase family DNA binding protein
MSSRGPGIASMAPSGIHTSPTPGLLNAAQAAALLNVPASWVLAEARHDRIPHVRLGRYVRFEATELEAWWLSRRRGPWRARGEAARAARTGAQPVSTGREAA